MSSNIDPSKPGTGVALTSDVRSNFGIAAAEISTLQSRVSALEMQLAALRDQFAAMTKGDTQTG
jgi:outer membrane murein-binding lipoprotein Lpp